MLRQDVVAWRNALAFAFGRANARLSVALDHNDAHEHGDDFLVFTLDRIHVTTKHERPRQRELEQCSYLAHR